MKTKKNFLILFVSGLLASCASIRIPETEVCGVAGVLQAGANCALTLSPKTREMTFEEFVEFLEPQPARTVNGKKLPERGAAMCQSADDFNKLKTTLEQACEKLGKNCTYEMKQTIASVSKNMTALQKKNSTKKGNTK